MKVITLRDRIRRVPERWKNQYEPFEQHSPDKLEIYNKLLLLDLDTCFTSDIKNIIGNNSWTRLDCDECQREVDWLVRLGEAPDYESRTACICKDCAVKVSQLVTAP